MHALRKFRFYLLGTPFTLFTDNLAVKYILNYTQNNGRRIRWVMEMSEFTFKIMHIKGKDNLVADGLSRQYLHEVLSVQPSNTPEREEKK